jgi:lipoprotein LpqH
VKHGFVVVAGCAALLAGVVGCSSQNSGSPGGSQAPGPKPSGQETSTTTLPPVAPAQPDQARVTFGTTDAGPFTGVGCETKDGLTTINIEGHLHTTVELTEGEAPSVKSVSIGEIGSDGPALAYVEGVSGTPVVATHDGKSYTVTGSGMGSNSASTEPPADMPFDIAVTCP